MEKDPAVDLSNLMSRLLGCGAFAGMTLSDGHEVTR